MAKVLVVVGAQFGSEGKGVVVHKIATSEHFNYHVRTGGPNAGHSFIHQGVHHVVQSIPCGFVDPDSKLVIGAGAVINPRVLWREINYLEGAGFNIRDRLLIDHNATVLTEEHEQIEGHTHGEIHQRIGSTGEGVGAARLSRLNRRKSDRILVSQRPDDFDGLIICDTVAAINCGGSVLLEGTQGSGLSLTHGPWPFCTSADTNAAQFCADAGISPRAVTDIMLVARTFPIRVAGNSGVLKNETTWGALSIKLGRSVSEKTTVTKKVRRVGEWDDELFGRAVMLNRPTSVAVTFLDYLNPKDQFCESVHDLSSDALGFLMNLEGKYGVKVKYAGTGVRPDGWTCVTF